MRSFHQLIVLFALVASVVAQEPTYIATTTLTSTIQIVLTATVSPGASSSATPIYSVPANTTMAYPTASSAPSSPPKAPKPSDFPGAASGLSANGAFIAIVAAALGLAAL